MKQTHVQLSIRQVAIPLVLMIVTLVVAPAVTEAAAATDRLKVRATLGQQGLLSSTVMSMPSVPCIATTTASSTQAGSGGNGGNALVGGLVRSGGTFASVSTTNVINATIIRIGR